MKARSSSVEVSVEYNIEREQYDFFVNYGVKNLVSGFYITNTLLKDHELLMKLVANKMEQQMIAYSDLINKKEGLE